MSQEYYDHLNEGEKYLCDKCNVAELSSHDYDQYIRFQYHYCEPCWNYLHIKKGKCESCGANYSNRNEYAEIFIDCPCGNKVRLSW